MMQGLKNWGEPDKLLHLTVTNKAGSVYIADDGIYVYVPSGKQTCVIKAPVRVAGICFGAGKRKANPVLPVITPCIHSVETGPKEKSAKQ